jgi:UPF0176 protein
MTPIHVTAFYKFAALPQFAAWRAPLRALCLAHGVRGSILLAPEGVNGTIAGSEAGVGLVMAQLRALPGLADMECKHSAAHTLPFGRMKVRLKKEIVTMGIAGVDVTKRTGTFVRPEDWNALIADPDTLVIDTRNGFEFGYGSFRGAIDPQTERFGQFPAFVRETLKDARGRKIAMFCTGGIRCEKATSFMLDEGFSQVFQLKGGILNYLERIPEADSLWEGQCFVFDERQALGHGLAIAGGAAAQR